jgi:hypothetical protein
MKLLKDSLLAEVEHQVEANDDYRSRLKEAMTCYWDMFSHGSTDYITRCHQCGISSTREQPFTELIMYFDESHHTNNNKRNTCTLGDLLESYNTREDVIDDYDCGICNRRTTATVCNRVRQYPRVLAIALSRGSVDGDLIKTCVNYPFENFKPNIHSRYQEDAVDTTYNLVATINHCPRGKGGKEGGHYTAICKKHNSDVWYNYDDHIVTKSNFSKSVKSIPTAKNEFQRKAGLLFYIRRPPTQDDTSILTGVDGNDDSSTNSGDKSRASKFSAVGNDNDCTQANTQNDDDQDDYRHIEQNMTTGLDQDKVDSSTSDDEASLFPSEDGSDEAGGNSAAARIVEVRVSIISAPIELNHTVHFNILVSVFSSCYSRKLNIRDRRALGVWRLA